MAILQFEYYYQSGTSSDIGVSSHEPTGEFWQYRDQNEELTNTMAIPDNSGFIPFIENEKKQFPIITNNNISTFGVKSFLEWGTGAHYTVKDEDYSFLVLPIHKRLDFKEPPIVVISVNSNEITFTITQNNKITYDCIRFIINQDNIKEEEVVYFKGLETIMYTHETEFLGDINITVQGFGNEINVCSEIVKASYSIS